MIPNPFLIFYYSLADCSFLSLSTASGAEIISFCHCLVFKINCAAGGNHISPKGTTKFPNLISHDSDHFSSFQLLLAKSCFPHFSPDRVSVSSWTLSTALNCVFPFPLAARLSSFLPPHVAACCAHKTLTVLDHCACTSANFTHTWTPMQIISMREIWC